MNIAIIYSSKYGTTEKICNAIASQIAERAEVTLVNTTFVEGEFRLDCMSLFEHLLIRICFGIRQSEIHEYCPIINDFAENIIAYQP